MKLPAGMTETRWAEIQEREVATLKDRCHADETRLAEMMDENERLKANRERLLALLTSNNSLDPLT